MQTITINQLDSMDFRGKEAYKSLRTNIEFTSSEKKVIAITSCLPNEGKSSVSMNLALSLSEAGKNVLFVDSDMRKSVIIGRYKIKNAKNGLSHYLSGQCGMEDVIGVTNVDRFHMVVAGPVPPNPSELLSSKRFERFLEEMRKVYDYIIVDCPPLGSVTDGLVAGKLSDGIVLVIASQSISYKLAQKIIKQIKMAECKILGVILNKVDFKKDRYYGKYYGTYYTNEE